MAIITKSIIITRNRILVTYVTPRGVIKTHTGMYRGSSVNESILAAKLFVSKYLRPASITGASLA